MVMQWPNRIPAGITMSDPVSLLDLFPTFLSAHPNPALAEKYLQNLDGVNLLPHIDQLSLGREGYSAPPLPAPHKHLFWRSGHYSALRTDRWKIQISLRPNRTWLFDLSSDPYELRDLANDPDYVEILKEILEVHDEVAKQQREPIWPSMTETAVLIDKMSGFNETLEDDYVYWPN
jgi:arylsulfatase A-like enzyme